MDLRTGRSRALRVIEALIVIGTLGISNRATWLCVWEVHMPLFSCEYGTPAHELLGYLALVALVLVIMRESPFRGEWSDAWKRNGILIAFLLLCAASVAWSVAPILTAVNAATVILCAIVASYLGVRYGESELMRITVWFSAAAVLLSYVLVLLLPGAAIMSTFALEGNWRGVFSHKNYTGAIIAYGTSLFALAYFGYRRPISRASAAVLFLLSAVLIALTRSATGVLVAVSLLCLLLAYLGWRRWQRRLGGTQYAGIVGLLVIFSALALANRDRLLALLGKDPMLTGRVPLWAYVVAQTRAHNLWLGYGLWTQWRFLEFRLRAQQALGWSFQVINGHSGFVDILLYMGALGLTLFGVLAVQTLWRAFAYAFARGSTWSAWMILTAVYVVLANTTISFFFQFETFHWLLLLVVLFACTPLSRTGSTAALTRQASTDARP